MPPYVTRLFPPVVLNAAGATGDRAEVIFGPTPMWPLFVHIRASEEVLPGNESISIDFPAMSNLHHQNNQSILFDFV